MPYFEVEQSVIDGLDEDLKGKFAAYTPEDVTGLKNKANEAVNEAKDAKKAKRELEGQISNLNEQLKAAQEGKGGEGNADAAKLQQQLDDANQKLEKSQNDYSDLQKSVTKAQITGEAAKLAAGLTKDATKRDDLTEKFVRRLAFDEGAIKVLDADGKFTISSTDDLVGEIKGKYPYLVDGSAAQGGGAAGNKAGGGSTEKTIAHSEYSKLSPREKGEKQRAGFSVIDD